MFGFILVAFSTLAEEILNSISKFRVGTGAQSIYTTGFVSNLGGMLIILCLGLLLPKDLFASGFPGGFVFSFASLPTLLVRVVLEIAQAHITLRAITLANRSTFGFLRTVTLPLLLVVDLFLGYTIHGWQIVGIVLIVVSVGLLFAQRDLGTRGTGLVLFTAVNAVATLSLYKYNISHFNSVEAEQSIVLAAVVAYFVLLAFFVARENPLRLMFRPFYLLQLLLDGIAVAVGSFAYLFLAASVATAAKRSLSVLWSVLSGNVYFNEKHLAIKMLAFMLVTAGTVLLVL